MTITKKCRPVYKAVKHFSIGDQVITPFNDNVKVVSIQKSQKDIVYKINLSNGNFIKTGRDHYNTVCFRCNENGKYIWDTITTEYIFQHQKDFLFKFPTLSTFSINSLDYETALKIIPSHENDPVDKIKIIPILERDENSIYITSVERSEDEESWCLTLNDPLGLYVLDHGSITHNSTFTQMALLFVAASFALMRDPWKFFNKSKTTIFAITLCAVTLTKAKEIYEEPIRQLIESADFWHYCRTHKDMLDEEKHLAESDEVEYIPWGHAAQVGVFKTGNNMTWKVISNANALLGVNILMGAMTEITFFKEAGKGWALKYNTPILMRDGTIKPLFEIKVGDIIAHPNNEKNVVKKIPFDEIDDDYEITLDDGRQVIANYHHIWKVSFRKDSNGNKVWDLAETGFILENIDKYKFEIPEVSLPITTMDVMNNI